MALRAAAAAISSAGLRSAQKRREQYSPPEDFWSPFSATTEIPMAQVAPLVVLDKPWELAMNTSFSPSP